MPLRRLAIVTRLGLLTGCILFGNPSDSLANDTLWENWGAVLRGEVPCERAVGIYAGQTYDWSAMNFALLSYQVLYDHETIWRHRAPDGLGVRLEGNIGPAGGTEFSGTRLMASTNVLAVYELKPREKHTIVPYIEGGIGLIYTDFQRPGQGSRVNFNPVAGVGLRRGSMFLSLRLFHVSNGGLDQDNRGLNALVLGAGIYLGGP
jgi:lipid A 3-O-deacylase